MGTMNKIPRPEYPRPQIVRDSWKNLNGKWDFKIGGHGDLNQPLDGDIIVPFPPESRLSGVDCKQFMPEVWYSRTFNLSGMDPGSHILLHFGAVDYRTNVWVNGDFIGTHKGGYTPFSFDISSHISDGENILVVRALDDNRRGIQPCGKQSTKLESHGCRYSRVTGIWQTVWLESTPKCYLRNLTVSRGIASNTPWLMFEVAGDAKGIIEAKVKLEGNEVGHGRVPLSRYAKMPLAMTESPLPWSPHNPTLYEVGIEIRSERGEIDRVSSYFGIRSLEVKGDESLINGKRIFQRLVLDQGYYPDGIYTAASDSHLRRDIEIAKEMGFNGARLHQKVFEPRFLYWADKLGYLVWGEFPSWGIDMSKKEAKQNFLSEWQEAVSRDINHPCIIGWCPFNETSPDQDVEFVRSIYNLTKRMDPGRPVIDTSGYTHVVTDIYDSHDYDQEVESFRERHLKIKREGVPYRNRPEDEVEYDGQPVMVSEFGGAWWNLGEVQEEAWGYGQRPDSVEEFLERFSGLTDCLLDNRKICGFCYTQLYDIEQEVNGLHTYAREAKFDKARIKEALLRKAAYEEAQE